MINKREKLSGQSLLEMVIALGVVIIVILALVSGVITAVSTSSFNKMKAQSTNYSQEGMEILRVYRDSDWTAFLNAADGVFHGFGTASFPAGDCTATSPKIAGTDFVRCAKLEEIGEDDNKVKAMVIVSWVDAKGTHKSELISYFTYWR